MGYLSWTSNSRTDVGCVRETNEDACLERPDIGLWVVADGMGGYTAGDVASRMIVEALGDIAPGGRMGQLIDQIEDRLLLVNEQLRDIANERDTATIGTTVAALITRGRHAVCLWAGDSRVYRCRGGGLLQVSQDHALVEELVERGVLSPKQAAAHPQANLVTRAVGATDELFIDLEIVDVEPGDTFILCSDGLDKEVTQAEVAEIAVTHRELHVSNALVELALSRGSRDNVTVIAVHIDSDEHDEVGEEEVDTVPYTTNPASA